jgi:hypothetical protein
VRGGGGGRGGDSGTSEALAGTVGVTGPSRPAAGPVAVASGGEVRKVRKGCSERRDGWDGRWGALVVMVERRGEGCVGAGGAGIGAEERGKGRRRKLRGEQEWRGQAVGLCLVGGG